MFLYQFYFMAPHGMDERSIIAEDDNMAKRRAVNGMRDNGSRLLWWTKTTLSDCHADQDANECGKRGPCDLSQ